MNSPFRTTSIALEPSSGAIALATAVEPMPRIPALDELLRACFRSEASVHAAAPLALLLGQIEGLDALVATEGREAADAVLHAAALDLYGHCRTQHKRPDHVGRGPGDLLAVVCPRLAHENLANVTDRLRRRLGSVALHPKDPTRRFRVAFGAALLGRARTAGAPGVLLRHAHQNLRSALVAGGGRSVVGAVPDP